MSRVVHVVSHLGSYGGERLVAALARAQCVAGMDVAVATIYDSPSIPGVAVHSAGRRAAYAPGGGFAFFFRLARTLRRLQPDIAHTHLAHAKYWGRLAAIAAGVPHIVHTEHANDFSASPIRRMLTALLHARTDRIIAFTAAHAQRIVQYDGAKPGQIAVIPNGIEAFAALGNQDRARAALELSPAASAILVIGRLDPVKAPLQAVEALALLPPDLNAHLYFIGDGGLRDALLEHARARGVASRTHLLGYRNDVNALLASADAVLNTSQSEAMPLSLIEALCAGLPVVSTPWPGVHELIGESGYIASTFDAAAIARELETVLRSAPRRTPEAIAALRERFFVTRAVSQHSALYEAVLEPDRAHYASPTPSTPKLSGLPQ